MTTKTRARQLVEDLQLTLTNFIHQHEVTHGEYRCATDLIIASVKAGEESLLFDVFLEAQSVDVDNARHRGSAETIEGPFYLPGAPALTPPYRLPQRANEPGDVLIFSGRVTDVDGRAIPEAELDIWQADATGRYSNIQYADPSPAIPAWNLRGRLKTTDEGHFEVRTIQPLPYEIPNNGPTGSVLAAIGRHFYRPAHLHVKVRHPDYRELTVQLYFRGEPFVDDDVAHAVRDSLIVDLKSADHLRSSTEAPLKQWLSASYNFSLERLVGQQTGLVSSV